MKNLVKHSVNRPITVLMGVLIVILLGVVSLFRLPLELFPDINLPYVVVVTTYEGKTPEEVEEDVTIPIEQNLLTINNVKNIISQSRDHFSMIIVEFQQSTNMDTAFLEVRESFELLELKDEVGRPSIIKFDPNMLPVYTVSLSRTWEDTTDEEALIKTSEWIKADIMNELERIPGVASVSLSGASDTEIEISLEEDKLKEYELTRDDVLRIIKDQNIEGLIGVAIDLTTIRMLYIGDRIEEIEGLKNTPIFYDKENKKIITLNDIGSVKFINTAQYQYMKINGKQGVSISFQKQSDVGITEVVNNIQKKLDEIVKEYGAEYVELLNQGYYIETAVGSVIENLIIGGILAIIILFVFLRDIKPTLIVGLSIPISLIGAFALMYLSDISLNIISMGGLALGVGMLVDNSIVVIENIYRLLNEGKSRKEAAIKGAQQVIGAIASSTLTTLAVFLPIIYIEGLTADIFKAMALTVAYSLLASLIIAMSLVPTASANILKETKPKRDKINEKLQTWYEKILRTCLNKKAITLVVIGGIFGLSLFLASLKGFVLLPDTDEGTITVNIEMEKGTSFYETANLTDRFVEKIMELDGVETVSAEVGGAGFFSLFGGRGSIDRASITVLLKQNRKLSTSEFVDKIEKIRDEHFTEEKVEKIEVSAQNTAAMAGLGGTGIRIEIKGQDIEDMRSVARDIASIIEKVEGVKDTNDGIMHIDESIWIKVNKEAAIKRGLTVNDFVRSINHFYDSFSNLLISETDKSLRIIVDGVEYDINIPVEQNLGFLMTYEIFLNIIHVFDYEVNQAIENKMASDETFILYYFDPYVEYGEMPIKINPILRYDEVTKTIYYVLDEDEDEERKLENFAKGRIYELFVEEPLTTVIKDTSIGSIARDGKTRVHTVTAKIDEGYIISKVANEVEKKVNEYLNSEEFNYHGLTVEFVGENEEIKSVTEDLIIAGIVAILLVFMIMAIQFQSLKYPFIVLFTIPLAFTGGFLAIFIMGLPLSMVAMVGLIILSGIVVNNGIVLVDYINQLRAEGRSLDDAIIEAGKTRLRPILMTALTTILALIPMAIGRGEGGELLKPLGITSIGGLTYATVLTLIVAPIMYKVFTRKDKVIEKDEE